MRQTFNLDIIPYSLNKYRNAHHYTLAKLKKEIGESVHWQLLAAKAKKCEAPVKITFVFSWKTKHRHDLDNYVATAKMVLDALTPIKLPSKTYGVGIIKDDDTENVYELVFKCSENKGNGVMLIIE